MKLTIVEGTEKEITALVLELQGRQCKTISEDELKILRETAEKELLGRFNKA